jgi:hypothetical protein
VEEQMANVMEYAVADSSRMTNEEHRRAADLERAARQRQRQALDLQRESILSRRTSNPGRRAALEAALAEIDAQIQSLG